MVRLSIEVKARKMEGEQEKNSGADFQETVHFYLIQVLAGERGGLYPQKVAGQAMFRITL